VIPTAASTALLTTHEWPDRWVNHTGLPGPIEGVAIGIPIGRETGPVAEGDDPLVGGQPGGVGGHGVEGRLHPLDPVQLEQDEAQAERGGVAVGVVEPGHHGGTVEIHGGPGLAPVELLVESRHPAAPDAEPRGVGAIRIDGEDSGVLDDQVEDHPPTVPVLRQGHGPAPSGEEDGGCVRAVGAGFESFSTMRMTPSRELGPKL
jgi:hypothetical protein